MNNDELEFPMQLALAANNPTIRSLCSAHSEGRVVLRPAFQRNLVWNDEQRSYLVDSILRNMPIPELYVQTATRQEDDKEVITIVDGQQRLSTCIEFYSGRMRLTGEDLDPRWAGRTIGEVDHALAERFKAYRLLVRDLPSLSDGQIREVFRRLNRVVEPLTPQELRHAAYSGPFIKLVEAVAAHPALNELRSFTSRDVRRRKTDEFVAEAMLAFIHKAFPNKKEGLDQAFKTYDKHGFPDAIATVVRRSFGRVLDQLEALSPALRGTRFKNKSDFYSLLILLLRRVESLPLSEGHAKRFVGALTTLSADVGRLRNMKPDDLKDAELSSEERASLKYLRAVEKAASDRLSRVRRNEVLEELVGGALAGQAIRPLTADDEGWFKDLVPEAAEDDENFEAEREAATDALLAD